MEPAEAELELVFPLGPREIVAILESLIAVLPWIVRLGPGLVQRSTLQVDLGEVLAGAVADREEAGRSPVAGQRERSALARDRRQRDLVTAIEKRRLVQQARRV